MPSTTTRGRESSAQIFATRPNRGLTRAQNGESVTVWCMPPRSPGRPTGSVSLLGLSPCSGPILGNVNTTIENVNTALTQAHTTLDGVSLQLARLDTITEHVSHVTANVANLTTVVTSAAASPLGKAAAFGFGLRRANAKRK